MVCDDPIGREAMEGTYDTNAPPQLHAFRDVEPRHASWRYMAPHSAIETTSPPATMMC
jgi:hypothetical protein